MQVMTLRQEPLCPPWCKFLLSPPCPTEHNLGSKEPLLIPIISGIIFLSFSKGPKTRRSDSNLEFLGFLKFLTGILRSHTPSPSVQHHERPHAGTWIQQHACPNSMHTTPVHHPLEDEAIWAKKCSVTGT